MLKKTNNHMEELIEKRNSLKVQALELNEQLKSVNAEITELKIAPFKNGQKVLCEIHVGRGKKWQECVIEIEENFVYVRPYRKDGELSGMRFRVTANPELFKEVH